MNNFIPTREALDIVDFGLLAVRQTTQGIRKSLGKSIRADLTRNSRITTLENVIADNRKKNEQENKIELLKSPIKKLTGGIRGAMSGTKSFFGGLLRAAGALLLGFLVTKLPEIIFYAQKIASIIKDTYEGAMKFVENLKNVFSEVVDVVKQGVENIKNFDFTDSEGKLQREIDEAEAAVQKTKTDFFQTTDKIEQTIEEMRGAGAEEFNKIRAGMGLPPVPETVTQGQNVTEEGASPTQEVTIEQVRESVKNLKQQLKNGEITNEQYAAEMKTVTKQLQQLSQTPQYQPSTGNEQPVIESNNTVTTDRLDRDERGGSTTIVKPETKVEPQNKVIPRTQSKGVNGTAEEYRVAAGLLTEGGEGQDAIDVLQVVMNRLASGRYSYAKSYTDILAAAGQFAGVEKFGSQAFRNISSLQEAAQWGGFSEELIQRTVNDMRNSSMRAEAARFVGGALNFKGSPSTIRNVPNWRSRYPDADAKGRIAGTSWRGRAGANQFETSFEPRPKGFGDPKTKVMPKYDPNLASNIQPGPKVVNVPFPLPPLNNNGGTMVVSGAGGATNAPDFPISQGSDIITKIKRYNSQFT